MNTLDILEEFLIQLKYEKCLHVEQGEEENLDYIRRDLFPHLKGSFNRWDKKPVRYGIPASPAGLNPAGLLAVKTFNRHLIISTYTESSKIQIINIREYTPDFYIIDLSMPNSLDNILPNLKDNHD
jgi:hypothetical protein